MEMGVYRHQWYMTTRLIYYLGHQLVMRKTPDGKSQFVTVPKSQLGGQGSTVITPAMKKGTPRKGAVSPTQFIQKPNPEPYTELAEAEHAAAMLMGKIYNRKRLKVSMLGHHTWVQKKYNKTKK